MKNVLIITYYWPPAGGPGVQRILKFARYLPELGIRPYILTVQNGDFPAIDESLENDIPDGLVVTRVKGWEPYNIFRSLTGRKSSEKIPVGFLARKNLSKSSRLFNWLRLNFFIPDGRMFLIRPFFKAAKELLKMYAIDSIITTGPPHSMHITGLMLEHRYSIPWIADFRDPWTKIYYYANQPRIPHVKLIDAYLERRVLHEADVVVTVSPEIKRQLLKSRGKDKIAVIYNGFDSDDFKNLSNHPDRKKFRLTYVGSFKASQNINTLWHILSQLCHNNTFASVFELLLVGNVDREIVDSINASNLDSYVQFTGYLSHRDATYLMTQSNVLLFIVPDVKGKEGIITGKIFDYLAALRPILAIGPPQGDAAAILKSVSDIPMIDYSAGELILNQIKLIYDKWMVGDDHLLIPDKDKIINYSRFKQTKQLAAYITNL